MKMLLLSDLEAREELGLILLLGRKIWALPGADSRLNMSLKVLKRLKKK